MTTRVVHLAIAVLAGVSVPAFAFIATPLSAHNQVRWMPEWENRDFSPHWQETHGETGAGGMPCINGGVFDPALLETVEGTAIDQYSSHHRGLLTLQTDQGTIEVHLGPAWYVDSQRFEISLNRPIEVKGFCNTFSD